jgi:hypothetical protein
MQGLGDVCIGFSSCRDSISVDSGTTINAMQSLDDYTKQIHMTGTDPPQQLKVSSELPVPTT